jgi:selenocysteine lyase/cysteine desulfurase
VDLPFDLARARRDTPGCANVLHFNNAGAALMPRPVLDVVVRHLERESEIGGYEAADEAVEAIERVYESFSRLLRCQPDEVAVVENATRAWDMAFYAVPLRPGDRILTAMNEYASNFIAFLQVTQRTGAIVEVVPNDERGQVSLDALRAMADERVKLIAITHVPTNGGLVNPAAAIGQVARELGALYLLDACQSVGQIQFDVEAIGCDMLSGTGRKYLRGPRGTGFLYVRRAILDRLEPPLLDLHAATWIARDRYTIRPDARRFENWETYVAGKLGLGAAVDYALRWGIDRIEARVTGLAESLRECLGQIPCVAIRDLGAKRCGIVTFTVEGIPSSEVRRRLAHHRINVTTSTTASTRFDMEARGLAEIVRASVHYYNSEEEVERFCAVLKKTIQSTGEPM